MLQNKLTDNPVLFIPGALTGEWIWENNFLDFFKELGFPTHTMSFSGHNAPFFKRNRISFEDYLNECIAKIESIGHPPILIAHSLGGLVALHAASKTPVHAAILLSPVPHIGVVGSLSKLGFKSPLSLLKFSGVVIDARISRYATPPLGIYSDTCNAKNAASVTSRLRSESLPVMLRLLSPPKLDQSELEKDRLLFIAATGDHIIPPSEVLKTATTFDSAYKIYDGLSHSFQVEESWPSMAEDMMEWLQQLDP